MARLSAFKIDSKMVEAGDWVRVGEEYDDLEILTRGFTDQYTDAHQAKLRKAARGFGGDTAKLPISVSRALLVESLVQNVILDVRNLKDDAGQPVLMPAFVALLRDPDYAELVAACLKAASRVGLAKVDDLADAVGNSAPPSA